MESLRGGTKASPHPEQTLYCFADFTLDPLGGTIRQGENEIELRSKSLEVLAYIVEHHGRLVTREELMQTIWPDVAVNDESLTRCIADIRKALSDEQQRFIRTVPRRGYIFAAQVTTPALDFPPTPKPETLPVLLRSRSASDRRYTLLVWLATVLISAVSVLSVAKRIWRAPETNTSLRAVPLITLQGVSRYPSFSPDGDRVAFTWTGPNQDNPDVYVQQIGVGAPLRLTTDPANDYNPVWSPDGRWIAFLRRSTRDPGRSEVRLVPPLGGPERKISEIYLPQTYFLIPPYLAWCADSGCLILSDSAGQGQPAGLFVLTLDSGEKRMLTHPQPPGLGDTQPAISPDGRWLIFRRQPNASRIGELYRVRLRPGVVDAGEPERLTDPAMDAGYPSWVPGGKQMLFASEVSEFHGNLWRLSFTGSGRPERLPFVGEDGLMPVVSRPQQGRSPRLVYVRSLQDSNIWRIETSAAGVPASTRPVLVIASSRRDSVPQLSLNGHRVVFASDRSGSWEIWASDRDGANAIQLTSLGTAVGAPTWSPDGQRIVFQASVGGQSAIYTIPATGGKPKNIVSHPGNDMRPIFSHDGKWIYFTSSRSGVRQIWRMPASGGEAVQITSNGAFAGFESPDGAYIYYNQSMETPSPLWRTPSSGGTAVKVLDGVVLAAFAILDRGIYYIDRTSANPGLLYLDRPAGEARLQYFDLATHKTTTVAHDLGNVFLGLTASQDGRTILFSRVDSSLDDLMLVDDFR
jgi:Tol biopolymer transport system component/DNA-binding winged helix-turn-helix (wHTH) protein